MPTPHLFLSAPSFREANWLYLEAGTPWSLFFYHKRSEQHARGFGPSTNSLLQHRLCYPVSISVYTISMYAVSTLFPTGPVTHNRFHQETMFGFRNPDVIKRSPGSSKSTKRFTKRMRDVPSTFTDTVSNTLKRASRRILSNKPEIPTELCPDCVEYVLGRSGDPVHDIRLITSLPLVFDGLCPHQELHIAKILATMENLSCLELPDDRIQPSFYTMLTERAQFQLEYLACKSPLSDSLLRFLYTQRHLLEFTYLARSPETQDTTRARGQGILYTVQTLSTTPSLLLHPRLDTTSLRHLEYMGGGQSLREEVRAIEKIYRLGPQLRSLRFMWGTGRTETFLDVTKFFCIATNTPSIKHIYLSDISRNVRGFPQPRSMFATYK